MSAEESIAAAKAYIEAVNDGDSEAFVAAFADDGVWIDPVGTPPNVGKEQIREGFAGFSKAFSKINLTAKNIAAQGNIVMMELMVNLTSAEGKAAQLESVDVFEVQKGKIKAVRAYWDTGVVARQLGG